MKKIYMKPETAMQTVKMSMGILAGSGVANGDKVGNDYNENDVTYGNEGGSVWDED